MDLEGWINPLKGLGFGAFTGLGTFGPRTEELDLTLIGKVNLAWRGIFQRLQSNWFLTLLTVPNFQEPFYGNLLGFPAQGKFRTSSNFLGPTLDPKKVLEGNVSPIKKDSIYTRTPKPWAGFPLGFTLLRETKRAGKTTGIPGRKREGGHFGLTGSFFPAFKLLLVCHPGKLFQPGHLGFPPFPKGFGVLTVVNPPGCRGGFGWPPPTQTGGVFQRVLGAGE